MNSLKIYIICLIFGFSFLFVFTNVSVNAQKPQDGIVAYYDMTDGMKDVSGNGNDGTISRVNVHDDISGEGLGSFRYNSKKDLITSPVNLNQQNTSQYTVAAWFYFESLGTKGGIVYHIVSLLGNKSGDGSGLWLGFREKDDENGYWTISGEGYEKEFVTNQKVTFGEWIFVAVSVDYKKNHCSLYINDTRYTPEINIKEGSETLYLGSRWYDNKRSEYMIDEVSVYKRALSRNEIKALKNSVNVHDAKAERQDISQYDYFEVIVDSTRVKTAANVDTPHLGFVYQGDSIPNGKIHKNEGRGYYKWLEINYKGEKGFLIMANLKRQNPYAEKPLNKEIFNHFGFYDKKNWTILGVVLLVVYILSLKFHWIDSLLSNISGRINDGARATLAIQAGGVGALMGLFAVVFEHQLDYFYRHFTLLPNGYGLLAWLVLLSFAFLVFFFILLLIESFVNFGFIHAIIRIILITAFSAVTFFGTMLVSMVAIYVAIGVAAFLFFGNASLLTKYNVRYSDGSTGTEWL